MAVKWLLLVDIYSLYQSQKTTSSEEGIAVYTRDVWFNSKFLVLYISWHTMTSNVKKNSYVYVSQLNSKEWKHLKIVLGLKKACAVHRTCIQTSSTVNYRLNISHFWQVGQARSFPRAHRILELTSLAGN